MLRIVQKLAQQTSSDHPPTTPIILTVGDATPPPRDLGHDTFLDHAEVDRPTIDTVEDGMFTTSDGEATDDDANNSLFDKFT